LHLQSCGPLSIACAAAAPHNAERLVPSIRRTRTNPPRASSTPRMRTHCKPSTPNRQCARRSWSAPSSRAAPHWRRRPGASGPSPITTAGCMRCAGFHTVAVAGVVWTAGALSVACVRAFRSASQARAITFCRIGIQNQVDGDDLTLIEAVERARPGGAWMESCFCLRGGARAEGRVKGAGRGSDCGLKTDPCSSALTCKSPQPHPTPKRPDTLRLVCPFLQEAAIIDKPLRVVGATTAPGCAGGQATLFQQRPPVVLAQARCAGVIGDGRSFCCSRLGSSSSTTVCAAPPPPPPPPQLCCPLYAHPNPQTHQHTTTPPQGAVQERGAAHRLPEGRHQRGRAGARLPLHAL